MTFSFFASTSKGIAPLLKTELEHLGATDVREQPAGVYFSGNQELGLRVCLWSRLANRVVSLLGSYPCYSDAELYQSMCSIPWFDYFQARSTIAIDFHGSNPGITHTRYGAQRIKDAIVDTFQKRGLPRPNVDLHNPDIRISAYLHRDMVQVGFDWSGDSLHKRGYRLDGALAPLKENLAAAMLIRAQWLEPEQQTLLDPMCGSGTIAIEAALMKTDTAPQLHRKHFGCDALKFLDVSLFESLKAEAQERHRQGMQRNTARIFASDIDHGALYAAQQNAERAGMNKIIQFSVCDVEHARKPADTGIIVSNPPYGERLSDAQALVPLFDRMGDVLKEHFDGWRAFLLSPNERFAQQLHLRAERKTVLYNGSIACTLLNIPLFAQEAGRVSRRKEPKLTEHAHMFENRLRKNRAKYAAWAKREEVTCYRIYDADLPEYNAAIDVYGDYVHVQEYAAPTHIEKYKTEARLNDMLELVPQVLGLPVEHMAVKVRERQRGDKQYRPLDAQKHRYLVREYGLTFEVNLFDYLDTGLFLDHRLTRKMLQSMSRDAHVLNLFCYTGSATVHAAAGGAALTVSVDTSHTYLNWAERNFELNQLNPEQHRTVRADVREWLEDTDELFDLVFVDPPTFSNSKRTEETFDIQRDHVALLTQVHRHLKPGGKVIFSCNYRKFKLYSDDLGQIYTKIANITEKTIPFDFERNPKIHHCFVLES